MKTMVILIRNTAGVRCRESASRRVRYGRLDCICHIISRRSWDDTSRSALRNSARKPTFRHSKHVSTAIESLHKLSPFIPASSFPRENPLGHDFTIFVSSTSS